MRMLHNAIGIAVICASLAACSSEKETVVHEQPIVQERIVHDRAPAPVIVQSAPSAGSSTSSVEANCAHGYDNATHSCY